MTDNETEQAILDCAKAATQGEWRLEGGEMIAPTPPEMKYSADPLEESVFGFYDDTCNPADFAHIAACSPINVIALIESKRALEEETKRLWDVLEWVCARETSKVADKIDPILTEHDVVKARLDEVIYHCRCARGDLIEARKVKKESNDASLKAVMK